MFYYYFLHDNFFYCIHPFLALRPITNVEVKQLGPYGHTDTQTTDRQSYSAELMSYPIFFGDLTITGKEFMR